MKTVVNVSRIPWKIGTLIFQSECTKLLPTLYCQCRKIKNSVITLLFWPHGDTILLKFFRITAKRCIDPSKWRDVSFDQIFVDGNGTSFGQSMLLIDLFFFLFRAEISYSLFLWKISILSSLVFFSCSNKNKSNIALSPCAVCRNIWSVYEARDFALIPRVSRRPVRNSEALYVSQLCKSGVAEPNV